MNRKLIAGACILAFSSLTQAAGIGGDSISFSWNYPTAASMQDIQGPSIISDAGVRFFRSIEDGERSAFVVDVTPDSITLTSHANTTFPLSNYFGYTLTDVSGNFPGHYSLVSSTIANLPDSFYSTVNNVFKSNMAGVHLTRGDKLVFALTSPVPEPESYAMLLAGMGLMGVIAKRRRQRRPAITA
jgi:hypothetical protein